MKNKLQYLTLGFLAGSLLVVLIYAVLQLVK